MKEYGWNSRREPLVGKVQCLTKKLRSILIHWLLSDPARLADTGCRSRRLPAISLSKCVFLGGSVSRPYENRQAGAFIPSTFPFTRAQRLSQSNTSQSVEPFCSLVFCSVEWRPS